jgi:hypothetical protein
MQGELVAASYRHRRRHVDPIGMLIRGAVGHGSCPITCERCTSCTTATMKKPRKRLHAPSLLRHLKAQAPMLRGQPRWVRQRGYVPVLDSVQVAYARPGMWRGMLHSPPLPTHSSIYPAGGGLLQLCARICAPPFCCVCRPGDWVSTESCVRKASCTEGLQCQLGCTLHGVIPSEHMQVTSMYQSPGTRLPGIPPST